MKAITLTLSGTRAGYSVIATRLIGHSVKQRIRLNSVNDFAWGVDIEETRHLAAEVLGFAYDWTAGAQIEVRQWTEELAAQVFALLRPDEDFELTLIFHPCFGVVLNDIQTPPWTVAIDRGGL